jgi:hypothetical protein
VDNELILVGLPPGPVTETEVVAVLVPFAFVAVRV